MIYKTGGVAYTKAITRQITACAGEEKMKRWIACLLAAMLLCLSGCNYTVEIPKGGQDEKLDDLDVTKPDGAARMALDALRRLDFDTFDQYSDNHSGGDPRMDEELNVLEGKIASALFRNLSCQAGEVKFYGEDQAIVTLVIENTDFSGVIADVMDVFISNYFKNEDIDGDEAEALVLEALENADTGKVWQVELEAEVNRVDGVWKLHLDEELLDAVCGGMMSSAMDLGNQLTQGIEGQIESGLKNWLQ